MTKLELVAEITYHIQQGVSLDLVAVGCGEMMTLFLLVLVPLSGCVISITLSWINTSPLKQFWLIHSRLETSLACLYNASNMQHEIRLFSND